MGLLTVVRHGQASLLSSDYDRLSDLGHEQGRQLGRWWAAHNVSFDAAYCGPARRHRETSADVRAAWSEGTAGFDEPRVLPGLDEHDAISMVKTAAAGLSADPEIAAAGAALAAATDRRERSAGFQRLFERIMLHWIAGEIEESTIESWSAFRDRVDAAVDCMVSGATDRGSHIVAFSSVGPVAVMLRRALGTTDLRSFETAWRLRNASVTRFVFSRERFTLDGFNSVEHLADPEHHTHR